MSAIEPEHGILLFLHQVMGVTDVRSFAGAVHGNMPRAQKLLDYFEMHGTEFALKATIPGDQVDSVKDRIVSRMMQLRGYADYEQRAGYARRCEEIQNAMAPVTRSRSCSRCSCSST